MARRLSEDFTPSRVRRMLTGAVALVLLKAAYKVREALVGYDRSLCLNAPDECVDEDIVLGKSSWTMEPWGEGLPQEPTPGVWRPYLLSHHTAKANLSFAHMQAGLTERPPEEMTIDQLIEGVRRTLMFKYALLLHATKRYWSRDQCRVIAESLAKDCGLALPLPSGGLDEVVPAKLPQRLPWYPWRSVQAFQGASQKLLRPFFHAMLSWRSRLVETPYGKMHVLDTQPPAEGAPADPRPPLLLQHGMFVTGWSMTVLGWLLSRRGRRVVMPDLFDFDYGWSKSDDSRTGGTPVRHVTQHLECLICIVEDLASSSPTGTVDLAGHSFGGYMVARLARCCEHRGLPVRKVVVLAPGGPPQDLNNGPWAYRFMNEPDETLAALKPAWLPQAPLRVARDAALGVLFSPNNCNVLFNLAWREYAGAAEQFGTNLPTLLLWGDCDTVAIPRRRGDLYPYLRAQFPDLRGFWVVGASHNLQIDAAVVCARAMEAFLDPPHGGGAGSGGLAEAMLSLTDRRLLRMDLDNVDPIPPSAWKEGIESFRSRL